MAWGARTQARRDLATVDAFMEHGAEVEAAVRLYIESWYRGNADEMGRALHGHLVKRAVDPGEASGLREVTRGRMVELTAAGGGEAPSTPFEVVVHHVEGDIASAHVATPDYLDYVHLVRTGDGWQIVNDLFRQRG